MGLLSSLGSPGRFGVPRLAGQRRLGRLAADTGHRAVALAALTLLLVASCGGTPEVETAEPAPATPETTTPADLEDTTTAPTTTEDVASDTPSDDDTTGGEAALLVEGELTVWFFDVGQGDSTLLQGPDFTILIDAGRHDRSDVVPHLQAASISRIDLLVGTHPHADHIGQFPQVLSAFPVTEVWMSGDSHTTLTFERVLDAVLDSDAGYHEPRAGETFQIGSARIEVVNPTQITGDLHDGSVSLRVVYGQMAFMFTGDAEASTEEAMVRRGHNLGAQVLQVGHHGSRTSSTAGFLQAVGPEVAIYSAGANNQYGHPHPEAIDRLVSAGAAVYGTDVHGTIRVFTDGTRFEVDVAGQVVTATTVAATTTTAAATPVDAHPARSTSTQQESRSYSRSSTSDRTGPSRSSNCGRSPRSMAWTGSAG